MSKAKVNGKTIYIGANMSAVTNALKGIEEKAQKSKNELKTLEKALKLDPSNVELLNEKQKTLADSIKTAKERLEQLEQASEKVKAEYASGKIDRGQYLKFKTAVLEAQNELKKLTEQAKKNDDAIENVSDSAAEGAENTEDLGDESQETAKELEKTADKANKTSKKFDLMGASAKTAKAAVKGVTSVLKASATVFTTYVAGASAVAVASVNVGKEFEKANSQLAATMGTTTDKITNLTQKAKELGEKTSFSATEAAQGLNILAQAGLNSEEQIASIGSVLDLAAAGTLSLEDSASYVTGTVKGFGDAMSNAQYYADLMAKGATLANTDVQGLGEALGKASATANSYGETADSVTLSLLKLANQNVTGETAATMLNRAMADLYTPTEKAKTALAELGISCYDINGETRDFNTVVAELNSKLSTMTDEEANTYKNTIFTVNGLNAFNKMCATSTEQSDEFAKSLSTASDGMGSAAQQAETMLDNLEGQITLMKSAAEGFGITIYKEMQEPLKNLVQEGTGYISELNKDFKKDGLLGVVSVAGDVFAEIVTKASEVAPDMINVSVKFIQSFVSGIKDNATELKIAAKNIVSAITKGMVALLPTEIRKPVETTIKGIQKSFNSGGLKKAVHSLKIIFDNFLKVGSKLAEKVLPFLANAVDFLGENIEKLLPVASGLISALTAYQIIGSLTRLTEGFTTALGIERGAVTLATVAQKLWNSAINANPVALVVTAVGALIGVLGAVALTMEEQETTAEKAEKIGERLAGAYDTAFNAAENFKQGVKTSSGVLDGFNDSLIISDEAKQNLEDSWNDVQKQIGNILNTASKERRELTQAEIDKLQELFDKEREIAKQQLNYQTSYQSVVYDMAKEFVDTDSQDMTADEYISYAEDYLRSAEDTKDEVLKLAVEQYNAELANYRAVIGTKAEYTQEWYEQQKQQAKKEYDIAVNNANQTYADTTSIIQQGYENKATALKDYQNSVRSVYNQSEREERTHNQTMYNLEEEYKANLQKAQEEALGDYNVYTQLETDATSKYQKAKEKENERHNKKLNEINNELTEAFNEDAKEQYGIWLSMISDTQVNGGKISEENQIFVERTIQILDRLPNESKDAMKSTVEGMIKGLEEDEPDLYKKAISLGDGVIKRLKEVFGIHSPSRVMRNIFNYVGSGAVLGLKDSTNSIIAESKNIANTMVNTTEGQLNGLKLNLNPSVSLNAKNIKNTVKSFAKNIFGQIEDVDLSTTLQAMFVGNTELIKTARLATQIPAFNTVMGQQKMSLTNGTSTTDNSMNININIGNVSGNMTSTDVDMLRDTIINSISHEINRRRLVFG